MAKPLSRAVLDRHVKILRELRAELALTSDLLNSPGFERHRALALDRLDALAVAIERLTT